MRDGGDWRASAEEGRSIVIVLAVCTSGGSTSAIGSAVVSAAAEGIVELMMCRSNGS